MNDFIAKRIKRCYVQHLQALPDKIFPLLCPVREYEWIEPWRCEMLFSDSGVAEKNCIFRARIPGESLDDVWVISHHEPNKRIEFVRVNALRVICYSICLEDNLDGTTTATNEQILTALNEEGTRLLNGLTYDGFQFEMRIGEAMLNHYLTTGKRLPLKEAVVRAGDMATRRE